MVADMITPFRVIIAAAVASGVFFAGIMRILTHGLRMSSRSTRRARDRLFFPCIATRRGAFYRFGNRATPVYFMKKSIFLVMLLCVLAGCSQQNDPRVEQLQNTVSQLQTTEAQLSDKITQLSTLSSNEYAEINHLQNGESNSVTAIAGNIIYIWNAEQNTASNVQVLTFEYNMLNSTVNSAVTPLQTAERLLSSLRFPPGLRKTGLLEMLSVAK
jgi:outer membrane murein-binding lipoprotein Lpp